MTPLANAILKQTTERKTVELLAKCQFFDLTEVGEILGYVMEKMYPTIESGKQSDDLSRKFFLPAPVTWLEMDAAKVPLFKVSRSQRMAFCCVQDVDADTFDVFAIGPPPSFTLKYVVTFRSQSGLVYAKPDIPDKLLCKKGEERGLAFIVGCVLGMINDQKLFRRQQRVGSKRMAERLADVCGRDRKKAKRTEWTEVKLAINVPADKHASGRAETITGRKALHFCRQHLRYRLGKFELVSHHWRGDAEKGVVQHRYKVTIGKEARS